MRIALLLGAASYRAYPSLEACRNDIASMKKLLDTLGLYGSIVTVLDEPAEAAKRRILDFLRPFEQSDVDEVFFYFTGHGTLLEDSLYFPMIDSSESNLRTTSISNSDIDHWLRQVGAKLTVKIVDCCHANVGYIKRTDGFEKAINHSRVKFENLYFLFSSQSDQSSYAGASMSEFTLQFLSALSKTEDGPVRYPTLADMLGDAFDGSTSQVPHFVTQATHREVFCHSTPHLRDVIQSLLVGSHEEPGREEAIESALSSNLLERVQVREDQTIHEPEASAISAQVRQLLESHRLDSELQGIYQTVLNFDNGSYDTFELPNEEHIGRWLRRDREARFFARATEYTPPKRRLSSATDVLNPVDRSPVVDGFFSTADLDWHKASVRLESSFSTVPSIELGLVLLWSANYVACFHFMASLKMVSWNTSEHEAEVSWKVKVFSAQRTTELLPFVKSLLDRLDQLAASLARRNSGLEEPR